MTSPVRRKMYGWQSCQRDFAKLHSAWKRHLTALYEETMLIGVFSELCEVSLTSLLDFVLVACPWPAGQHHAPWDPPPSFSDPIIFGPSSIKFWISSTISMKYSTWVNQQNSVSIQKSYKIYLLHKFQNISFFLHQHLQRIGILVYK